MTLWMQLALAAMALVALFYFGPRAAAAARNSPRGSASDWMGALLPIGGVVLFVLLLIWLAQ